MRGPFIVIDDVRCFIETESAILCKAHGNEVWIPKSQIHENSEVYAKQTNGRLIITEWIAKQKDLQELGEEYEEEL